MLVLVLVLVLVAETRRMTPTTSSKCAYSMCVWVCGCVVVGGEFDVLYYVFIIKTVLYIRHLRKEELIVVCVQFLCLNL